MSVCMFWVPAAKLSVSTIDIQHIHTCRLRQTYATQFATVRWWRGHSDSNSNNNDDDHDAVYDDIGRELSQMAAAVIDSSNVNIARTA